MKRNKNMFSLKRTKRGVETTRTILMLRMKIVARLHQRDLVDTEVTIEIIQIILMIIIITLLHVHIAIDHDLVKEVGDMITNIARIILMTRNTPLVPEIMGLEIFLIFVKTVARKRRKIKRNENITTPRLVTSIIDHMTSHVIVNLKTKNEISVNPHVTSPKSLLPRWRKHSYQLDINQKGKVVKILTILVFMASPKHNLK